MSAVLTRLCPTFMQPACGCFREKFGDMVVRIETRMKETRPQVEKRMTFREYIEAYKTGVEGYLVQDVTPQIQGRYH